MINILVLNIPIIIFLLDIQSIYFVQYVLHKIQSFRLLSTI